MHTIKQSPMHKHDTERRRRTHVGFGLRFFGPLGCLSQKILYNLLKRIDVNILTCIPILHERLLCIPPHALLNTEVNEAEHDLLKAPVPGTMAPAGENIMKRKYSSCLLSYSLQLFSALECVLRPLKGGGASSVAMPSLHFAFGRTWKSSQCSRYMVQKSLTAVLEACRLLRSLKSCERSKNASTQSP
jgi:hypothetical protein